MLKNHAFLLALLLSPVAYGADVDRIFSCEMTASDFFRPLLQHRAIDLNAYQNIDSISYFHFKKMKPGANRLAEAKAFGFPILGVIGYVSDQSLFRRGPGTEPMNTYGLIVGGDVEKVKAGLSRMGASSAIATKSDNNTTEVYCEENNR